VSGPFREGGPVPPCEACAKRARLAYRWDRIRRPVIKLAIAVTTSLCLVGIFVIGRSAHEESARENRAHYACQVECMSEHRVSGVKVTSGRCFCALKPGNGWDVSPSEWVEVQP
jgi:hypothetical protein